MGFGAMEVTNPYKFIGFGAMEVTNPYGFCVRGLLSPQPSKRIYVAVLWEGISNF